MTKKKFANQTYQLIKNGIDAGKSEDEIVDDMEVFLNTLEPRDRESFSKWGYEKDKSTPELCWADWV